MTIYLDSEIAFPTKELSKEATAAVLERVRAIVARGNVAVFTRPNRIEPSISVVKRVVDPTLDATGDLLSDRGYVAPWDAAYVLTEEPKGEPK
jgi:hypothetical protein